MKKVFVLLTASLCISSFAYAGGTFIPPILPPAAATQAEAEAGTETGLRSWSPAVIKMAIDALGAGDLSTLGDNTSAGIDAGDTYTNYGQASDDSLNELFAALDTALGLLAPLASPGITGDPTITDATPTITLQDSDNAAGTAAINFNSSGGANDIIATFGVEDSSGQGTGYLQLDGVNERINALKPLYLGPITIDGTDDSISNGFCAGIEITGVAGATLVVGDTVYQSDTDARWELADNNSTTAQANKSGGVVSLAAAADGSATRICIYGKMRYDTWNWNDNEGQPLYLSSTAGDLTETRPTTADEAVQQVGHILSDDEIFINPQPIDYSITRTSADADGRTLTCLEASNTVWLATGAGTFTLPAVSTCPTLSGSIIEVGAVAVVLDVNASDRQVQDGVANADGHSATSTSTAGDMITYGFYDADGPWSQSNGWTAE